MNETAQEVLGFSDLRFSKVEEDGKGNWGLGAPIH